MSSTAKVQQNKAMNSNVVLHQLKALKSSVALQQFKAMNSTIEVQFSFALLFIFLFIVLKQCFSFLYLLSFSSAVHCFIYCT
jgi:hypothetical protein